jgi:hypothetical protein
MGCAKDFAGSEELEDGGAGVMLDAVKMMIRMAWLLESCAHNRRWTREQMRGAVFR